MIKYKAFLISIVVFCLIFCLNNISFAADNIGVITRYPDYAFEFTGIDKCENFNRKMFNFNLKFNKYIVRPINIVWASVMPQYGMDRVKIFYTNINYPVRLISCLLQKDFKSSKTETKRFLTNTTLGVVGLYDPALTKYKIAPRDEDMGQVLAYYHVKKGPYLVLPIIDQGNIRDIGGDALNLPLNPTSYIVGPISAVSTGLSYLNETSYMQPVFKLAEDYADPYETSKQLSGIDRYIKNSNLDRIDVFKDEKLSQNMVKINNTAINSGLKADIKLNNYNPQSPLIDAMRTIFFDNQNLNDSKWSDLSVWNKSFTKKFKFSSVNIGSMRPNYKYRYVLQKNKQAPLAIIYPSIGESIMSNESTMQAKILYDEGYSVAILGSTFQWAFVKSMPDNYRPGLPYQDASYLRNITSKVVTDLQVRTSYAFNKKIIVGTSFGGLTALFVAVQENTNNTLGISNYITINPPIEIFFALKQIDKYSQDWKNNPTDLKYRAALTAEKVIQVSQRVANRSIEKEPEKLPFNEDEAKLAISFAMKQKLSDVVFIIEHGSTSKKSDLYKSINDMSFYDYAQKYLISNQPKSIEQLDYDSSLYSLADFLQTSKNYKIYHSLDDCFVNPEQLIWLKKQSGNKAVFLSNGSHLGFLYRKEFIDAFKKDIDFQKHTPSI